MTEDVISAVAAKLYKDFKGCTIYAENVEQNIQKPCFTINVQNKKIKNFIGRRKLYRCELCIHYIGENTSKEEMNNITDKMFKSLEFVECVNDNVLLHGENMSAKIAENNREIDFFAEYAFMVYIEKEAEDAEMMEKINTHFKSRFA